MSLIQEHLNFISQSYPEIPAVTVTGTFDNATQQAVLAYEREFGLPERGYVNLPVWNSIVQTYQSLKTGEQKSFGQNPGYTLTEGR